MRILFFAFMILGLFAVCGVVSANLSSWPMLSHDSENSGYTTFNGAEQADKYWTFHFGTYNARIFGFHQAIVRDDGVIYFGTDKSKYRYPRGGLFALYPNGTLKGRGFGEHNVATPAIDENGDLYVYVCNYYRGWCRWDTYTLFAYYKNGTLKWRKGVGFAPFSGSYVRLKVASGVLYVSFRNQIKAFSADDGSDRWTFTTSSYISDFAVDGNGNVYIGDNSGNLYALKPDGSVNWTKNFPSKVSSILFKDGSILVGYAKNVSDLNPDGTLKWNVDLPTDVYKLAAKDDNVYVRTYNGVCSINNGNLDWCKTVGGFYVPDIIVDGKGTIYTTTYGSVLALDTNGNIIWRYSASQPRGISIGKNTVYVMLYRSIISLKDLTPPKVEINSPLNGTTYFTNTISINVSASDPSGIAKVIAQIDGSTNVTLSLSNGYYIGTTTLANGNHWIRIYANDTVGNINSTQVVYFTVSATITTPTPTPTPPPQSIPEFPTIIIPAMIAIGILVLRKYNS